jgi:hypothetical protein
MQEVKLASGKTLKISLAAFAPGRRLYQAVAREAKALKVSGADQVDFNLKKDLVCTLLSSESLEKAVWDCMDRCLYDDLRITEATFEDEHARGDYITVLIKVAEANLLPFLKDLYAEFALLVEAFNMKSPT